EVRQSFSSASSAAGDTASWAASTTLQWVVTNATAPLRLCDGNAKESPRAARDCWSQPTARCGPAPPEADTYNLNQKIFAKASLTGALDRADTKEKQQLESMNYCRPTATS